MSVIHKHHILQSIIFAGYLFTVFQVRTLTDVEQRTQLVMDRSAFERDPEGFIELVRPEQEALTAKLVAARERLPK